MKENEPTTIAQLYPELDEQQIRTAEDNLRRSLAALLRIAERLEAEGRSINDLSVDCPFDQDGEQL